jgi:hypothetical protein
MALSTVEAGKANKMSGFTLAAVANASERDLRKILAGRR